MIITFITEKCTTAIYSDKILLCTLKDDTDLFINFGDKGFGEYVKIYGYKTFNINVNGQYTYSIYPGHVREIINYYENETASGVPEEKITAYISGWLTDINKKVFSALLGVSTSGITEGWITKSSGVDGIDINIELLARQIRLRDLTKAEKAVDAVEDKGAEGTEAKEG